MDILNEKVINSHYGIGIIEKCEDSRVVVNFNGVVKEFLYPKAFEKFLRFENPELQMLVLTDVETEKEKERLKKEIQYSEQMYIANKKDENAIKRKKEKTNVAFKCNFCDGGVTKKHIGFSAACSDYMINYNIEEANHSWCCDISSPCHDYYCGNISRNELDSHFLDDSYGCYESQMLKQWRAFAGYTLTGENKGRPMKLNNVRLNSLAVLTTREPYSEEKDRFVFGVFLVGEAYDGDNVDEGYVTSDEKYRLELYSDEAHKIKYWNYYFNANAPEKIAWGQGLHRYLNSIQAAQLLRDIAEIKTGKEDGEFAKEFYEYFCRKSGLNPMNIPEPNGALVRINSMKGFSK